MQVDVEKTIGIYVGGHTSDLVKNLYNARMEERLCDFTIKVGSRNIPVHKIVLSEGSDYFKAMFAHPMKENQCGFAEMEDVDPECMTACINYIYTGKVSICEANLVQLFQVAHMLQLKKLCERILLLLGEKLDSASFFYIRQISITFSCSKLEERCNQFALKNFKLIALREKFKEIEKDYLAFLLGSKNNTALESVKCKALLLWTQHDLESRSKKFEEIFQKLDLTKIPDSYLRYLEENETIIQNSTFCLRKILRSCVEIRNAVAEDVAFAEDVKIKESFGKGDENVIAVFNVRSKSLETFDPVTKSWQRLNNIFESFVKQSFTAVVVATDIYVLANDKTDYKLNYTDPNASWVRLPKRTITKRVVAAAFDDAIYALDDVNVLSKSIEKFDVTASTWSRVCDKPVEGFHTSVVAAGDFFFCIGGFNGDPTHDMTRFEPSSGTWTTMPPMPTKRYSTVSVHMEGNIYVAGGYNTETLAIFECFDIAARNWTTLSPLNHPRRSFSACAVHGKIFAVGGCFKRILIEEFDPSTMQWKIVEMNTRGHAPGQASVALKL